MLDTNKNLHIVSGGEYNVIVAGDKGGSGACRRYIYRLPQAGRRCVARLPKLTCTAPKPLPALRIRLID